MSRFATAGRGKALRVIPVLLLVALPLLAGCVRVKGSMSVTDDDHVSGQVIAVAQPQGPNDKGPQFNPSVSLGQKVQVSSYQDSGWVGSRAIFNDLTFSEVPQLASLNKNASGFDMTLRRNGDIVTVEGRADLTALPDGSNADVSLSMSFPGTVESTNGERLGDDSVQWKLNPGVVSTFTATARSSDPSTRSFSGATIAVTIVALLAGGLVAFMAWQSRDQSPRFS